MELKSEHIDHSWENETTKAAGLKKLTPAGAEVVESNVHLYYARQMQDRRLTLSGIRVMDIHTPEERAAFAANHPEAWAQAAAERAARDAADG